MNALIVFQAKLDEIGAAVMANDYAIYASNIVLPFHLHTESANIVVETDADLRAGFDAFQVTLRCQHISDMIRLADGAASLGENMMSGRYVTHLLSAGQRVVPPFNSQMTLRLADGIWRAVSITNSLFNQRWPIHLPNPSSDKERG